MDARLFLMNRVKCWYRQEESRMGKVIIRNKENILPKEEKSHEPYHYKKYQVAEA